MCRFTAAAAACFVALSCAVSDPANVTPDMPDGVPEVDAGGQAIPAKSTTGADAPDPPAAPPPADSGAKTTALPKPGPGDVVITEVMFNPSGPEPKSEWFELTNKTSKPLGLDGLTIVDGAGRKHTIASATIQPGAFVVLARDKAAAVAQMVPAAAIIYEYGTGQADTTGILLTNGAAGAVSLQDGSSTITDSLYGPDYSTAGNGCSIQRGSTGDWCYSANAWATGSDKGTPGAASDCP